METEIILQPKQEAFMGAYMDPQSPTFSNALQSGLQAGYSQEYSESITYKNPKWLSENVGNKYLIEQAMTNLNEFLTSNVREEKGFKWLATKLVLQGLQSDRWGKKPVLSKGKEVVRLFMIPQVMYEQVTSAEGAELDEEELAVLKNIAERRKLLPEVDSIYS